MKKIHFIFLLVCSLFLLTACNVVFTSSNSIDLFTFYNQNENTFLEDLPEFEEIGSISDLAEMAAYSADENTAMVVSDNHIIKLISITPGCTQFNINGIAIGTSISEAKTILENSGFIVTVNSTYSGTSLYASPEDQSDIIFFVGSSADTVNFVMVSNTELAYLISSILQSE